MNQNEYHIQVAVVQWLVCQYPKTLFTTSPAGVKLPIVTAMKMKRMGYRKGTPDLIILEPRGEWHGLFVEIKTEDGIPSMEQKVFISDLLGRGYYAKVCYGFEQTRECIDSYLKNPTEENKISDYNMQMERLREGKHPSL